jgi:hypothetical protein
VGTPSSLRNFPSSLDSSVPRPEYPRPQFARNEWVNLNGWWKFRIDDQNIGLEQQWFSESDYTTEIMVPFSLESAMSGIGDPSFHPCVWYQRGIEVPVEWAGRRIRLNFGAVDYRARSGSTGNTWTSSSSAGKRSLDKKAMLDGDGRKLSALARAHT